MPDVRIRFSRVAFANGMGRRSGFAPMKDVLRMRRREDFVTNMGCMQIHRKACIKQRQLRHDGNVSGDRISMGNDFLIVDNQTLDVVGICQCNKPHDVTKMLLMSRIRASAPTADSHRLSPDHIDIT
mmetsp:Transcript_6130/g.13433  ORF Transcript_6130/g.13433 Transcript_6130/m.13433 type:complete len:127 (-) Transcript_6130:102-482(-)